MVTLKADEKSRIQLPAAKPGQVFACEEQGEGQFVLTLVENGELAMREVKLVEGPNGLYQLPEGEKLSREEIVAAVKAGRERR